MPCRVALNRRFQIFFSVAAHSHALRVLTTSSSHPCPRFPPSFPWGRKGEPSDIRDFPSRPCLAHRDTRVTSFQTFVYFARGKKKLSCSTPEFLRGGGLTASFMVVFFGFIAGNEGARVWGLPATAASDRSGHLGHVSPTGSADRGSPAGPKMCFSSALLRCLSSLIFVYQRGSRSFWGGGA